MDNDEEEDYQDYSTRLENEKDFEFYKLGLDVAAKYHHQHIGKPDRYPARVKSTWGDNPNGPYFYEHQFIYRAKVICPTCGHEWFKWPEEPE